MPSWKRAMVIREDLTLMDMKQEIVKLDKPIYTGVSVLDFSKQHMFGFWYDVIKKRYNGNARLCLTDTDSFILEIMTDDLVGDILEMKEHFDLSEYPKDHPLYDPTNAKVLGKFKDECAGAWMSEFVGHKAKCYSYTLDRGLAQKGKQELKFGDQRLKGIPSMVVKKQITIDNYRSVLETDEILYRQCPGIRSIGHTNYSMSQKKKTMTSYDDKRHNLDAINTLAYGHWQLRK